MKYGAQRPTIVKDSRGWNLYTIVDGWYLGVYKNVDGRLTFSCWPNVWRKTKTAIPKSH